MNQEEDDPVASISFEQFSELKKADRADLMDLPPDEAQAAVEQILYPRLWRIVDPRQLVWPGDLADSEEGDSDDAGICC